MPTGHNLVGLTITYYDNYDWTNKNFTASHNSILNSDASQQPHYEQMPSSASTQTKGMVTGTKVRIIEAPFDLTLGSWLTRKIIFT